MTSTPTRPVDNVVIATKGLQDRNTNIIAGTTVENKGKLILTSYPDSNLQELSSGTDKEGWCSFMNDLNLVPFM